jgi:putative PIN family toxin of toxin-antitoxin system
MKSERVVIDTNVLISAALDDQSVPARARNVALQHGQLIGTDATMQEFVTKLLAAKFDPYVSRAARETLLQRLQPVIKIVPVVQTVKACRDSQDDKFLEAAINGRADVIITGDKDLLALHPFSGVEILAPADYLARKAERE